MLNYFANAPLGKWKGEDLIKIKRAMEYSIFSVIEATLRQIPLDKRFHYTLLKSLYENNIEPTVISLNYDVIVDNAMFLLSDRYNLPPPDYCVDIATWQYRSFYRGGLFGKLLKIHGSLNWLYCDKCERLDLFISEGAKGLRTNKALTKLYSDVPFQGAYSSRGAPCYDYQECGGFVSPILITPTY